jgi:hypothetical protein
MHWGRQEELTCRAEGVWGPYQFQYVDAAMPSRLHQLLKTLSNGLTNGKERTRWNYGHIRSWKMMDELWRRKFAKRQFWVLAGMEFFKYRDKHSLDVNEMKRWSAINIINVFVIIEISTHPSTPGMKTHQMSRDMLVRFVDEEKPRVDTSQLLYWLCKGHRCPIGQAEKNIRSGTEDNFLML